MKSRLAVCFSVAVERAQMKLNCLRKTSLAELLLSPLSATILFVLACLAGIKYRRVWVAEGPRWQLWAFGTIAAICLLAVAFIPLSTS